MISPVDANDSDLAFRLSKGDLEAFNAIYRRYSGPLYRFSFSYLRNESEAEELVQEVYTIIWTKRSEINEDLSIRSFLFTIAFNIIKKHFRSRTYMKIFLESRGDAGNDISTFQNITRDSLFQYISGLVDRLPQRRKEIFIKSRFEGKTIREISEEMGISHKTVENQLTEALRFLRTHLNREYKQNDQRLRR